MCEMQIVKGNYEKALELSLAGQKKWPDDPDFIEMEYAASAKMKGK